jgi:phage FluMu protein Com
MTFPNLLTNGIALLNNLLTYIILKCDIKIPPKYFMENNMDDDEKNKQEDMSWQEYMNSCEDVYADYFVEEELKEPYFENQISFANAFCDKCHKETLTLIRSEGQKIYLSKCPTCKTTHRNIVNGE